MPHRLYAAVLAPPPGTGTPPPGIDHGRWRRALLADTADVVDDLAGVALVLAGSGGPGSPGGPGLAAEVAAEVAWPGVAVVAVPDETAAALLAVLDDLAGRGATIGAVVAGDAPDLPGLLVGKLFSAAADRPAGVLPAAGGGLTGLAARLPVPAWLRAAGVGLDTPDALERLHAAAPVRAVTVGPGWHRLRAPGDIGWLDEGLEGWFETRALLRGGR